MTYLIKQGCKGIREFQHDTPLREFNRGIFEKVVQQYLGFIERNFSILQIVTEQHPASYIIKFKTFALVQSPAQFQFEYVTEEKLRLSHYQANIANLVSQLVSRFFVAHEDTLFNS